MERNGVSIFVKTENLMLLCNKADMCDDDIFSREI